MCQKAQGLPDARSARADGELGQPALLLSVVGRARLAASWSCLNGSSIKVRPRRAEENSEGMIGPEGLVVLHYLGNTCRGRTKGERPPLASWGAPNPRRFDTHREEQRMIVGVLAMAFMVGGLGGLVYRGGWGRR
jgi:hypothetical protein